MINVIIFPFADEQAEAQRGLVLLGEGRVRIQTPAYQHCYGVDS